MKKILSLILALIMMLSTATMIFADDAAISDETPVEVDETTSPYYEAVKFLVNYDIMHGKGDTLGVFDNVKRYEAALFFGRILTGWTDDSAWEDGPLNSSEFNDLAGTAAEAFYGAISYVNQMGVIEGYGDGKFGPEDGIRYQDLLAMGTRALGYSEKYPWGCIQKAVELGLTDGITGVAYTDTLKREVVAQVIYNILFAEKKAGGTLAKDVFDLELAWTTVVITGTDKTAGVPTGYVSYAIVNADGTIGTETFYAPAEQFGLVGEHDDEKAFAALYNVMFETTAEYGLNNVIAAESLELDTVVNAGIYSKTLAGYPIQVFLADYDIVTRYTPKTYLNAEPEIIIADVGLGMLDYTYVDTSDDYLYVVDWATGNIVKIDFTTLVVTYDSAWLKIDGETILVPADEGFDGYEWYDGNVYGLTPDMPLDWDIINHRFPVINDSWEYLCVGDVVYYHWDWYSHHDINDDEHNGDPCDDDCCPLGEECPLWEDNNHDPRHQFCGGHGYNSKDDYIEDEQGWDDGESNGELPDADGVEDMWDDGRDNGNMESALWLNLLDEDEYTVKSIDPEYTIEWYYNALLDTYFQIRGTVEDPFDQISADDEVGIVYMDEETRANLSSILNYTGVQYDKYTIKTLAEIESDAAKLNAYASLRVFDANKDSVADYGIYEEYRFGIVNSGNVICNGEDCDGTPRAGYIFTDLSNTPIGGTTRVALEVVAETSCKHGMAWLDEGVEIVDGSYVIYGYNPATGETKIVKTIAGAKEDADDADYIVTGYLREFDATKATVNIGGEDFQYDYTQLKGSIADVMNYRHGYYEEDLDCYPNGFNDPDYNKFLAVAARFLRKLYNQVVEAVVVDDKIVYMELSGDSDSVIVVESYAGLHEDGTIVVWGYLVGANETATKLQQFRIASYNSWIMGDWYNYSWNYTDVIEAAFTTGTVYQIKSYDEELKAYNVEVLSSLTENEYDYTVGGVWTELYYGHAGVNWMATGSETNGYLANARSTGTNINAGDITAPHHNYFRKMADTDTYVFIYDVNKSGTVAPIVTYTGKVTDPDWYVKGWRVNGDVDGSYVFVIDGKYSDGTVADVKGFGGAQEQGIGVVLFLEYGSKAAFDAANGRDYLVGSTVYSANAIDLVTGKVKEVTAYNGALRSPSITWSNVQGIEGDGWGTEIEWELGSNYLVLYHEDGKTYHPAGTDPWDGDMNMDHGPFDKVWVWDGEYAAEGNGVINLIGGGSLHDGYKDAAAYHFFSIDNIKGYMYKTVNNVIVNDEPLTAAEAGALLGKIIPEDASIETDDFVGETGYIVARNNGVYSQENQIFGSYYGNTGDGNELGFNQYSINRRLTYDAFGVAYIGLSPFTLNREGVRGVRVYALRDVEKGMVELRGIGVTHGGKPAASASTSVLGHIGGYNGASGSYWGDGGAEVGKEAMMWFCDTKSTNPTGAPTPANQLYKYSLIYNCDRSNATMNKGKDMSYCLVYIYDDNSAELQPAEFDAADFDFINK